MEMFNLSTETRVKRLAGANEFALIGRVLLAEVKNLRNVRGHCFRLPLYRNS